MGQARKSIFLTSPYFIPDEPMLYAIECAAMRGVDVRLLVPARGDVALVSKAARSYYPAVLRSGARVYEYLPSMLHAKTVVMDGMWCIVGSANLDIRSFRLNFELGILVRDSSFGRLMEERFFSDLRKSRELKAGDMESEGRWNKMIQRIARLVSPML
ncbi:MAG: hypothetical protein HZB23_05420 [Deltaproteobacteria bacterium]|nr:hypothetical protein [Deltaproteobacteria bacterium]